MSVFEMLQDRLPVEEVVGAHQEIRGNKVRCLNPDHQDTNPSMHLFGDHVHCFACGFHGDVTDVWAVLHGFDRPIEAALDLAREYAIELPDQDPQAQKKAQECRKKEDLYKRQARRAIVPSINSRACASGGRDVASARSSRNVSCSGRTSTAPRP